MSDRGTIERINDSALARCRQAFAKGRMPANIGDLVLAMESEHVTNGELEYLEHLAGNHEAMQIG